MKCTRFPKLGFVGVNCHPERSEGSPIAQNKNMRNEILRLTAQNDNACVGGDDPAPRCRGGSPCPPVNFDIILRNNTKVVPYDWIDNPQFTLQKHGRRFLSTVLFEDFLVTFSHVGGECVRQNVRNYSLGFAFNFSAVSAVINASIISSKSPFKICSIL